MPTPRPAPPGPFLLHGVACGGCGRPGYRHDPRTKTTEHIDGRVPPCYTRPPHTTATVQKGATP